MTARTKTRRAATVFAPATIGNVGPGFDVLGLAVEGLGDEVRVMLDGAADAISVEGRDAGAIPREPARNAAWVAAKAYLKTRGESGPLEVSLTKGLPLSGGMGGSAASSVGGALAAALALGGPYVHAEVLEAALEGERSASSGHWDNIAPCYYGGLCLVLREKPMDLVKLAPRASWWLTLVTPAFGLETRAARQVLAESVGRSVWVWQMANTAGVVAAFLTGDASLLRRSLRDLYAEPARAPLIANFGQVKDAALGAGAMGCSISGAGPTVFAISETRETAARAAEAMVEAFLPLRATAHVGQVATQGARAVER